MALTGCVFAFVLLAFVRTFFWSNETSKEAVSRLPFEIKIIDGHNDLPYWVDRFGFHLTMDGSAGTTKAEHYWVLSTLLPKPDPRELVTHTDLQRLKTGRVGGQFFSIFIPPTDSARMDEGHAFRVLRNFQTQIRKTDGIEVACTAKEVRSSINRGFIAALFGLEGLHALTSLDQVNAFYDLGVRYVTLTWSNSNQWGGATDSGVGLSKIGKDLLDRANDIGLVVDVSHASDETFWDVARFSKAPFIASHSASRHLVPRSRNLSDDMIRAIAKSGGIVMVNFGGIAVDPSKSNARRFALDILLNAGASRPTIGMVVDHIKHIRDIVGVEHIGFGSDFDGTLLLPSGLSDVSEFPNLIQALIDEGFSETDIRKIAHDNIMRVLTAAQVQPCAHLNIGESAQKKARP